MDKTIFNCKSFDLEAGEDVTEIENYLENGQLPKSSDCIRHAEAVCTIASDSLKVTPAG